MIALLQLFSFKLSKLYSELAPESNKGKVEPRPSCFHIKFLSIYEGQSKSP